MRRFIVLLFLIQLGVLPSLALAQEQPVMLRLQLAVCEALQPGFPSERLATGRVTVDGVTEETRWPTVPISLPESLAARAGLAGDAIVSTSVEQGEVLANGAPLTPEGRALLSDLCAQLAQRTGTE